MPKDLTVAVRDYAALDRRVTEYQYAELSPLSREHYDAVWQSFVNFASPKDAWRTDEMDVARWLASMAARGVSPLTLRTRLTAIN